MDPSPTPPSSNNNNFTRKVIAAVLIGSAALMLIARPSSIRTLSRPIIAKATSSRPIQVGATMVAAAALAGSMRRLMKTKQGRKLSIKAAAAASKRDDPWQAFEQLPLKLGKTPPVPKRIPHKVAFGTVEGEDRGAPQTLINPPRYREDDLFWMRDDDRKNPEILQHLESENAYTNHQTHHLRAPRETIYKEILSHVQETDETYPYRRGAYEYYSRTIEGSSYKIRCRRKSGMNVEEVFLNENELAKGKSHCEVGDFDVSKSQAILAFTVDEFGYEEYSLRFKDLTTGRMLEDVIPKTSGKVVFGNDEKTVFYATMDEAHRTDKVWMHRIGTPVSSDILLYQEDDTVFDAGFEKSSSQKFLFFSSSSSETSEVWALKLEEDGKQLLSSISSNTVPKYCLRPRKKGILYEVDHHSRDFYITTNVDGAANFKLVKVDVEEAAAGKEDAKWQDVFPYDADVKINEVHCFNSFIAITGRQGGFSQIWTFDPSDPKSTKNILQFEEEAHTVDIGPNFDFGTTKLRLTYGSLVTPRRDYEYTPSTSSLQILKQQKVPLYDRSKYSSERIEIKSRDGTLIPVSLVYRKDLIDKKKTNPLHLYGYGSYEISIDPEFATTRLPLLDRGVIFAIAHVRGGGEMGRTWYESAKYSNKARTFTDFIDCANALINLKWTSSKQLSIEGRSAGGLLVGAVVNMAPRLFKAAVAGVPFVDVMNTMSDPSIPLTTGEWEEWGNPNMEQGYNDMLKYSPYDNIGAQDYPAMFVSSGLYDPRVAYWEPAKWVSKLRHFKTDNNPILLKMDLSAGHFSASDRYRYFWERSLEICFILDQLKCLK